MRILQLTKRLFSTISDESWGLVSSKSWHVKKLGDNYYAIRQPAEGVTIYLHREILGLTTNDKVVVDHIDHDTLNNQLDNLRIVTIQENCCNRRAGKNNRSGFLGVFYDRHRNKWVATVSYKRVTVFRNRYATFEEAKVARIEAEQKYFGEFAPRRTT